MWTSACATFVLLPEEQAYGAIGGLHLASATTKLVSPATNRPFLPAPPLSLHNPASLST